MVPPERIRGKSTVHYDRLQSHRSPTIEPSRWWHRASIQRLSKCMSACGRRISVQFFEYSEWKITTGTHRIHLISVYRPPYSEVHPITTSVFLTEFADYLESTVLCTDQLLITGDFNLHVDVIDDSDACRFHSLTVSGLTNTSKYSRTPVATSLISSLPEILIN